MSQSVVKSLLARGERISDTKVQLKYLSDYPGKSFDMALKESNDYPLKAGNIETLQINLGKMCNQVCEHCHVDAGPDRKEIMTRETMNACLKVIDEVGVKIVDLTGGAPEMNPDFEWLVKELSKRKVKVLVRSNLTIIVSNKKYHHLPLFFKENGVKVISSLPCYTEKNTDSQRGKGVFSRSIEALHLLNEVGYGKVGTEMELDLVYNPGGPSLPPDQLSLEKDYKQRLKEDFAIDFNHLLTITNLPISRFLESLLRSERYEEYMNKLVEAYNPAAVKGLMCLSTISVGWDGQLYDCDFNQMLELGVASPVKTINEFMGQEIQNRRIVTANHCFGCTAGSGSGCGGAIV